MGKTTYYPKAKRTEKLSRNKQLEMIFDLINSFRMVKGPIEMAGYLQDLLTAKEIKNLAKRLRIAKLLLSGLTHEDVTKEVHCSYSSVAKISIWLSQGGEGIKKVVSKLPAKYAIPKKLPPVPLEFQLPKATLTTIQYFIAKNQNIRLEKFLEGVSAKEITNRSIRESQSLEYRGKRKKPRTKS